MKNKIILSALLCTLSVTGCGSNSSSISSSSSSESSVSSVDTSTSSSSSSVNTSSEDSSSSSISSVSGNKYEDKYYQIPEGTENFTFGIFFFIFSARRAYSRVSSTKLIFPSVERRNISA